MAFVDFSSSDLKKQVLPHGLLDTHTDRDLASPDAAGYRIRLTFLVVAEFRFSGARSLK